MQLDSYFDFVNECAIRIRGHRIGIEHVLGDYCNGASPAEILLRYPTLTLEEIDATIHYYRANKHEVDEYLDRVERLQEEDWRKQHQNPPKFVIALRKKLDRYRRRSAQRSRLKIAE